MIVVEEKEVWVPVKGYEGIYEVIFHRKLPLPPPDRSFTSKIGKKPIDNLSPPMSLE